MGNQGHQGNYGNEEWKSHPSMGQVGPSNRQQQQLEETL